MPKAKQSNRNILYKYVSDHSEVFKTDGKVLFCKICNKSVSFEKKFLVDQHLHSQKHKDKCQQISESLSQPLITSRSTGDKTCVFNMDLCEAFLSADIPLFKLNNVHLTNFLKKYTKETIPSETTLRKTYVDKLYNSKLNKVVDVLKNSYLWVSIDETIDIEGRLVANVIVGVLDADEEKGKQKFLLNVVELDKANHATIARAFNDSISLLGENFNKNQVLLYLTDAAPYMVKSASYLNVFYPKMTHVTCLAHGMHRVAEEIRNKFDDIDLLISYGKKIFIKAPKRVEILKEMYPTLNLPPRPVITRWGTWLEAVEYYAQNFDEFKNVVYALNEEDAVAIKKIKAVLNLPCIKNDIVFIFSNYAFLINTIVKLQEFNTLSTQVNLVEEAIKKINEVEGEVGQQISQKLNTVIQKNNGFSTIKNISRMFTLTNIDTNLEKQYTIKELTSFKHAPITSVDVERSFSTFKTFLRPNRLNFTFENIKKNLFIYANKGFI